MARIPIAAIYLALLFALNVYRAATQSFVIDEGYSYQIYVGREPFFLFRQYDASLHVLHTLLCWGSVKLFGLSELTFRLPSLLGCGLYFSGVYRLSGLVFSDWWRKLLAVVVLTANPLIEDHMSVGRGYGLALGFLAWAFCEALSDARRPRIAVLLALSVASNFTFLFPSVALLAMVASVLMWQRGVSLTTVVQELLGPWLVLTFLLLVMPFSRLEPGVFYFGAADLKASLQSLVPPALGVVLVIGAILTPVWRLGRSDAFATLACGTLVLTIAAVVAAHVLFDVPYPQTRTGLYLVFLLPLCLLPLARWKAGIIALLVLAAAMAQANRIDRYMEWTIDANSREIVQAIVAGHGSAAAPVRIACEFPVCYALRMYTSMWKLDWADVQEVTALDPGFDYYLLSGEVEQQAASQGLRVVYSGPLSGVALAVAGVAP